MSWLVYAFLGMTIWSAAAVADRALLLRIRSTKFYLVVPTLLQLLLCIPLLPLMGTITVEGTSALVAFASGVMEALVLYFLYIAVSKEEVSRVYSLAGFGPVLTLVFGALFLGETLTMNQLLAFALFLVGGVILSARLNSGSISLSKSLMPLFIGSLISSLFFLLLRQAFVSSDFWSGFFLSRIGFFAAGLIILYLWRGEIVREWSRLTSGVRLAVIGNQVISFSGHYFYFLALSLASAALVQATLRAQAGIIFMMAIAVAYFCPRLVQESLKPRDLLQKFAGIALTAVATYILAVS